MNGDWVRQALNTLLNSVFIIFVLVIVTTYAWISYVGIWDTTDRPIDSERFNQVWTGLSATVGAIVGWMIRELTSGNSEEAAIMRERGKHVENNFIAQQEIATLSRNLHDNRIETAGLERQVSEKEQALHRMHDEVRILGALKSDRPDE